MSTTPAETRSGSGITLGDRVRALRHSLGLTQEELADHRFSNEYLSQIERGATRPSPSTVVWLAERLGTDVDYLELGVGGTQAPLAARAEELLEAQDYAGVCELLDGVRFEDSPVALRAALAESWARSYLGELDAALELLDGAEAHAQTGEEVAEVLFCRGVCTYKLSDVDAAHELFTRALEVVVTDRLRARLYEWRSRCHRRRRDWAAAGEDIAFALELASTADGLTRAHATFQASIVAERTGELGRARRLAEDAIALFEECGDRQNTGRLLNNLGGLEHLLGRSDRAIEHLLRSFALALDLGNDADTAQVLSSLARVHLESGDTAAAIKHARHALELLEGRLDYLDELGNVQIVLGRALLGTGDLDGAEACFAAAETAFTQLASASHTAAAWTAQGDLALRRGDDQQAVAQFRRAALALHVDDFDGGR